jgi:hypothetical protein
MDQLGRNIHQQADKAECPDGVWNANAIRALFDARTDGFRFQGSQASLIKWPIRYLRRRLVRQNLTDLPARFSVYRRYCIDSDQVLEADAWSIDALHRASADA